MKETLKPRYIKCPRCELNYIDANKVSYCDVCLNEMKGAHDDFDDFDSEEDELMELCPICGENMMKSGEECCEECKKKRDISEEEEAEADPERDDEWRSYLADEAEDSSLPEGLPPEDIADDFDDDEEGEEEEPEKPEDDVDDFEYVSADEIYDIYGDDEDDEDDDDFDDDFDDDDEDVGVKIANKHEAKKKKSKSDK